MRNSIKKSYQEFIDYIEFPTAIYIYETGNIIAMNEYAKNILGHECKNMNHVWQDQMKQKYSRKLLNGASEIFYNRIIEVDGEKKLIDIEVNSIIVDKYHILFCLFELSQKHYFTEHLRNQVPRIMWKDEMLQFVGANSYCKGDLNVEGKSLGDLQYDDMFDSDLNDKLTNDDREILLSRDNKYNLMEELRIVNKEAFFIKLHRMPIINYTDQIYGVLYVYTLILNQEERENLIQSTLKENVILKEVVSKSSTIIVRWNTDTQWTIEYISPNIVNYGYDCMDFYSKKATWSDIVHPDDYNRVYSEHMISNGNKRTDDNPLVLEYRILTTNNEIKWVREESIALRDSFDSSYREGVVNDITSEKEIEKELIENRGVFQIRMDDLISSNKTFDNVDFWSLIDLENMKIMQEVIERLTNIWGFLADNKGNILTEIVAKKNMKDDIYKMVTNPKSTKLLKEITQECNDFKKPIMRNYFEDRIIVTGIPIAFGEKYIGTWFLFASIKNLNEYYPILKDKGYESLISIKQVKRKNYDNIILSLWSYVKYLCNTILTKLELIDEKRNIKETSIHLERQLDKSNIITNVLKLSHLERPYQEVLNNMFNAVSTFSEIDHVCIYETFENEDKLTVVYEWCNGVVSINENKRYVQCKNPYVLGVLKDRGGFAILPACDNNEECNGIFHCCNAQIAAVSHLTLSNFNDTIIVFSNTKENKKWKDVEISLLREVTPIIQNVIVKARALETISISNLTLGKVLNNLDNYVFVVTADENEILFVNSMVTSIYGDAVIGSNYKSFCYEHKIEIYDNVNENNLCEVIKEGKYKCYDFTHERHLSVHAKKIQWIDNRDAIVLSIQDITSIMNKLKNEYGLIF